MHAEPASGAGDERGLARLHMADLADGVEDGPDGAGDDRRLRKLHAGRYQRDVVVLDRHILRVAAHHAVVAQEFALLAERLASGAAMPAGTADVIALGGRHRIARLEFLHRAPD